jgi:hypothetical protein
MLRRAHEGSDYPNFCHGIRFRFEPRQYSCSRGTAGARDEGLAAFPFIQVSRVLKPKFKSVKSPPTVLMGRPTTTRAQARTVAPCHRYLVREIASQAKGIGRASGKVRGRRQASSNSAINYARDCHLRALTTTHSVLTRPSTSPFGPPAILAFGLRVAASFRGFKHLQISFSLLEILPRVRVAVSR